MLADALLEWYGREARDLPWRRTRDPYAILVSEVMLQQTQVARVVPRYVAWLERWPTPAALAAAPVADVLAAWVGLGYNRRALRLREACAVGGRGRLARGPADAARHRAVHRGGGRRVRLRARRAAGRHERPPRAGAHGLRAGADAAGAGPGADGAGRHGLPRARGGLRRLPGRGVLRVGRRGGRGAARTRRRRRRARALRGLQPLGPRPDRRGAGGGRRSCRRGSSRSGWSGRSRGSCATGWCGAGPRGSAFRPDR